MNSKSIVLALAVVLTSLASFAQLRPGGGSGGKPGNQDPNRPGQYQPPGNGGGGGYYPPPSHAGGGGYYPPPSHGGGGGYYPPPPPPYYPPPQNPYYPPPPPPPQNPYYPPAPPTYGQRIVKQVYVGRSVQDEMYQLSYYADLSQYYGWEVTAVRATTRPNSPYQTVVSLVDANRSILARQINPGYQIQLFPSRTAMVDSQDLYLWIQGSTFIETIEVELMQR